MARRGLKVEEIKEIERLIKAGISDRQIAALKGRSRDTIRQIRRGEYVKAERRISGPAWSDMINWHDVHRLSKQGHPIKYYWQENASNFVSYKNFLEQFHKKFPLHRTTVTARQFRPGEYTEVDWCGWQVPYYNNKHRKLSEAHVFVGILCYSQKIFASAHFNMKSVEFLDAHNRMWKHFGGVTKVVNPDNLKTGVSQVHLYDPEINTAYREQCEHYSTVVVPTRVARPKDKALVENAVKLIKRMFRWKYRAHKFMSISEVNRALLQVCEQINKSSHSRFGHSREERFFEERSFLLPLPETRYEIAEWKTAKLHPDCHIVFDGIYYSAPYRYRGEELRVKRTASKIEVFHNLERVAIHLRGTVKKGEYVTQIDHLPDNSKAFYETTPQSILSQARFINEDLAILIRELFNESALGHLRRAQGIIREARTITKNYDHETAQYAITAGVKQVLRFNKVRVKFLKESMQQHALQRKRQGQSRDIVRRGDNPNLRYTNQGEPNGTT